ncbi:reverse transcriptase domain-containing protein [Tanacetum coccineum]
MTKLKVFRESKIIGAHLIGRIAIHFGLMSTTALRLVTRGQETTLIDVVKLGKLGIVRFNSFRHVEIVNEMLDNSDEEADASRGQAKELTKVVLVMSKPYDQFYGEFRGMRLRQKKGFNLEFGKNPYDQEFVDAEGITTNVVMSCNSVVVYKDGMETLTTFSLRELRKLRQSHVSRSMDLECDGVVLSLLWSIEYRLGSVYYLTPVCATVLPLRRLDFNFALGWHLEEIHVTWDHLGMKRTRLQLYTKIEEEKPYSSWRRRRNSLRQCQNNQATASGLNRLNEALEDSTGGRRHKIKMTIQLACEFFPPGRTAKLRKDILMFQQCQDESLYDAWTRFKDLLRKVPHRGLDLWLQVQIFYDHDLTPITRRRVERAPSYRKEVRYIDATLEQELESIECQVESLMRSEVLLDYEVGFTFPERPCQGEFKRRILNLMDHQEDQIRQLKEDIESLKSSTRHSSVNEFVVINIPEDDVETKQIILDPNDQPMWESAKTVAPTPNYAIVRPVVDDNFAINSTHFKMILENKFDGQLRADPHDHIREFLTTCSNMVKLKAKLSSF